MIAGGPAERPSSVCLMTALYFMAVESLTIQIMTDTAFSRRGEGWCPRGESNSHSLARTGF